MSQSNPAISVVVCTHNRAPLVALALGSLVRQKMDPLEFEILVVDNASSDGTPTVVANVGRERQNVRYIHEPTLGLNRARNRGLNESRGGIVAFIDDDAVAAPDWLLRMQEAFSTVTPIPGCVGGRIDPLWPCTRPDWLTDYLADYLAVLNRSESPLLSHERPLLNGVNMAVQRDAALKCGGFHPQLDRRGSRVLLSSGDILLQYMLIRSGLSCYYDPRIVVQHHVIATRLTKSWFLRRFFWEGVSEALMWLVLEPKSGLRRRIQGARELAVSLTSPKGVPRLMVSSREPWDLTVRCKIMYSLGHAIGLLAFRIDPSHKETTVSAR